MSDLLRRAAPRGLADQKARVARLVQLYSRLQNRYLTPASEEPRGLIPQLPSVAEIAAVEAAALAPHSRDGFGIALTRTGDADLAAIAHIRALLRADATARARVASQALQRNPGTKLAGDIAWAICAVRDARVPEAWRLFTAYDAAKVLALVPAELFRAGFMVDPPAAATLLRQVKDGEIQARIGPRAWQEIAKVSFAAGEEELSAWALRQAETAWGDAAPEDRPGTRLPSWYGRRDRRDELSAERTIALAVLDNSSPQAPKKAGSRSYGDQQQVLLAELARHADVKYDGDVGLVRELNDLVARTDPNRSGNPVANTAWLYRAGRDATIYADVPNGTWLALVGRIPDPLFGIVTHFPYDARYRPVFASIHIEHVASMTPAVIDQLRRCAPVGCADWDTYYLVRTVGVEAFLAEDAPEGLRTLVTRILAGDDEDAVRDAWKNACAPAVAKGLARDAQYADPMPIVIDIENVCRTILTRSTVVERREPGPAGPEINLEFSLDGNLRHEMIVVLDSIVRRCSRPIRLFVMCRDHVPADFERLAVLFPTVSFVWLPTDDVSYGQLPGMIKHITVSTMDRLLLPALLPDIDRIIHHDVDAVCLADLAELADIDLQGNPVAAVVTGRARYVSGIGEFRGTAHRMRRLGDPEELARELIARSHLRHAFDFDVFNAGVMVLDLAQLRADNFCREFIPYAERFGMNDQAVLCAYAGARRLDLDPSWNWCPRQGDLPNLRVAHWWGPMKPWKEDWVPGKELWEAAEELTAARVAAAET